MKKIVIFILILFCTGCVKEVETTKTIIEHNNNYVISINYPLTNIKEVDDKIKKYIDEAYQAFKKNNYNYELELSELNIDGNYDLINDRYVKVYLEKYVYDAISKKEEITDFSINYDKAESKFIDDIVIHQEKEEKNITYTTSGRVINPFSKVIALTFDDGPSNYTDSILEVLKEYDASATFFVLGNKVKYHQNTLIKLLEYGNEIGNHTYNHKLLSKLSEDEVINQIEKTQAIIKEYTGFTPTLFRPSYGTLKKSQKDKIGLEIILWNIDTLDWKYKNSKTIANRALSKAKDGSIILMHDTYKRNIEALKIILSELKKENYQFVTVSELLNVRMLRNLNE